MLRRVRNLGVVVHVLVGGVEIINRILAVLIEIIDEARVSLLLVHGGFRQIDLKDTWNNLWNEIGQRIEKSLRRYLVAASDGPVQEEDCATKKTAREYDRDKQNLQHRFGNAHTHTHT